MNQSKWLTLSEVIDSLQELEGEADWQDIENLVTSKRGGSYEPYKDWRNYTTTMRQLFQEHCIGYGKYKGPELFRQIRQRPLRYRLLDPSWTEPDNRPHLEFPDIAKPSRPRQMKELPEVIEAEDISEPPARVQSATYRIIRDTILAREIKELHKYKCQVCHHNALKLGENKLICRGASY